MIRAGILLIAFVIQARAEFIDLKPVADTTIHEINPNNNIGSQPYVSIGATARETKARGLFKFDLSEKIPTEATITNVSLTFTLIVPERLETLSVDYELHRVLRSWGEGNKSGPLGSLASDGEATWNCSSQPTTWTIPGMENGIDFVAEASSKALIGPAPATGSFGVSPLMIQDLEGWRSDSTENFGWMIRAVDESISQSAKRFASRESTNAPVLRIEYSLAPEFRITSVEKQGSTIHFEWSGGSSPYQIESLTNLLSTNWAPVTTLLDSTNATFSADKPDAYYRVKMVH
jgi:hypothetical protein